VLRREGIASAPQALGLLARESGGSVRDALSLADQVLAGAHGEPMTEERVADVLGVADRALIGGLLAAVVDREPHAALSLVDDAFRRGYDLVQLAHTVLGGLRDLVVVAAVAEPAALLDGGDEELATLRALSARASKTLPEILFQRFSASVELIAKAPVARHALEVGLVELCRAEPLEPISGLLDKIVELEGRLEAGPPPPRHLAPTPPPAPGPASVNVPASAPVAASAPTTIRRAPQSFTELIEAVMNRTTKLAVLSQSRCVAFTADKLSVAFDRDFDADVLRERVDLLRETLTELLGRAPTIEIIVGSTEDVTRTENLIEVEQRKVDEDRERRRRESLEHPVRKALDDRFGGTWKDPVVDLDKE
jgi:DNA polymerase-3 subunit gamma/tau